MRDWKTTRFKKSIRVTDKQYEFIQKYKGKKSLAGFLEEIINSYICKNGSTNKSSLK